MPVTEVPQAVGSHTQIIAIREGSWANTPSTLGSKFKSLNIVGGETLDNVINTYKSEVIRADRMRNQSVRGTFRPGGNIPFELAAKGWSSFIQALLGGAVTTTGATAPYNHVFKGDSIVTLPSFTIEKGFLDLGTPQYFALHGCRVNSMNLNFGVDQIVKGTFDLLARDATMSATSHVDGVNVTLDPAPDAKSFTSVQAAVYLDGTPISVVRSADLTISNNLYGDTGFVLGSNFRQNLKAGARDVSGNATFLFQDVTYYNAAVNGTIFAMKIKCLDSDGHYVQIELPKMQFLPNSPTPKIANDGPLELTANFESLPDSVTGTNVKITIENDEATIDY